VVKEWTDPADSTGGGQDEVKLYMVSGWSHGMGTCSCGIEAVSRIQTM